MRSRLHGRSSLSASPLLLSVLLASCLLVTCIHTAHASHINDDDNSIDGDNNDGYSDEHSLLPITLVKVALGLAVWLAAGLSNAGGVGGGILFVPLFLLAAGLTAPEAAANAQPLIFAGVLASLGYHARRKHPFRTHAPRIDWELASVLVPAFLAGTTFGLLPHFVTSWLLALLLAALAVQALSTGACGCAAQLRARRKHNTRIADITGIADITIITKPPKLERRIDIGGTPRAGAGDIEAATLDFKTFTVVIASSEHHESITSCVGMCGEEEDTKQMLDSVPLVGNGDALLMDSPWAGSVLLGCVDPARGVRTLQDVVERESHTVPAFTAVLLLVAWVAVFVLSLLRGSRRKPSIIGVHACSWEFWLLLVLQEVLLALVCGLCMARAARWAEVKQRVGGYTWYDDAPIAGEYRDVKWTTRDCAIYPSYAVVVGVLAALLGLGGATLLLPLLLVYARMDPVVVSSTTALVNLLGAAASTAQFAIAGSLYPQYSLSYGACAFAGSLCGVALVMHLVAKYQLKAAIVLILAGVFLAAFGMMAHIATGQAREAVRAGVGVEFGSICH
eukprot:jgi/Chlat1/444/Chrsp103S00945